MRGHEQEVCGLKWSPSGSQLASGGNDNLLHVWGAGGGAPLHRLTAHTAAVKALAWCPFQSNLLASGGGTADRCIRFWNTHTGALLNSIDTHSQARQHPSLPLLKCLPVLRLSQCLWPLLQYIECLKSAEGAVCDVACVTQVCALQWSRHEKEILSSHGFSQNQLCLWKYPSMAKVRYLHSLLPCLLCAYRPLNP